MVKEWARLRSLGRMMRRSPYVAYCVGVVLMFVYAFSALSNFGILARQRVQVLPFFLVLLCLPRWEPEGLTTMEALAERDAPAPEPRGGSPTLGVQARTTSSRPGRDHRVGGPGRNRS